MRSLKVSLGIILMLIVSEVWSQSFVENALYFSRTRPGGSARVQGIGGAQVALGGDYSSALSNPAGLGMYNRSEFTFSPALNFYKSESSHLGNNLEDSKAVLNIPGVSYVWNMPVERGNFLGGSFGISLSRTNDFQNTFRYGASTSDPNDPSLIEYFIQDADGFAPSSFDNNTFGGDIRTQMAYFNYLIEDSSSLGGSNTKYYSVMGRDRTDDDDVLNYDRAGSVDVKGAQYQLSLAYGGNLSDKFYFGASVGITTIRYRFKSIYNESNFQFETDPTWNPLDYLQLEETIDVEGTGINLTLGFIYRPANFVQLGASLVTPTFYSVTDSYTARLKTQWNNFDYFGTGDPDDYLNFVSDQIDPLVAEYNITTPMKISTGVAFFLGKYGFITGDVEFINYGKAKYTSTLPDISFDLENESIRSSYTNVMNTRIGAEFRYDIYRLRGGYGLQTNPYNEGVSDTDYKLTSISTGAGLRFQKFFIDAAWIQTKGDSRFSVFGFSDGNGPVAKLKNTLTSTMVTVGFNF